MQTCFKLALILTILTCLAVKAADDMTIKSKLLSSLIYHKNLIGVNCDVQKGIVTIEGEVKNFGDKAFAERLATNIPGVYRVRNLLVIEVNQNPFTLFNTFN